MRACNRWLYAVVAGGLALTLVPVGGGCAPAEKRPEFTGPAADRQAVVAEIQKRLADPEKKATVDEFDEMVLATDMDGAQLGAFLAAIKERNAKFSARQEGPQAKRLAALKEQLAQARQAADEAKVQNLQGDIDALNKEESDFRTRIRADVVQVMTLDQQRDWATEVLWGRWGGLGARFARAKLTDAQVQKARAVCRDEMAKLIKPGTLEKDPYLWCLRRRTEESAKLKDQIAERITKEVLTDEQRAAMPPRR